MKIAVVTEFYYPTLGGVQEHVHHFAREARRQGHRVTIVTGGCAGAREEPGVVRMGRNMPLYVGGSTSRITVGLDLHRRMRRLFDQESFDLVHIHSPFLPTLPYIASREAISPTVGTVHTNFGNDAFVRIFGRLLRQHLDALDGLISVSPTAARALERNLGLNRAVRVIPNGVDPDEFTPDGPRIGRFDDDVATLLFMGRLEARNGVTELLRAFAALARREPRVRLLVAGEGPLRGFYEASVPAALRSRVHFLGPILAERPAYVRTADVLVAPMLIASFGIVLLEGMAAGVPVVANDIDGFRDVMTHEREGLFADARDPEVFAAALARVLRDGDLGQRLGVAGRRTAEGYAWSRITGEVLSYYEEVLRAA